MLDLKGERTHKKSLKFLKKRFEIAGKVHEHRKHSDETASSDDDESGPPKNAPLLFDDGKSAPFKDDELSKIDKISHISGKSPRFYDDASKDELVKT